MGSEGTYDRDRQAIAQDTSASQCWRMCGAPKLKRSLLQQYYVSLHISRFSSWCPECCLHKKAQRQWKQWKARSNPPSAGV